MKQLVLRITVGLIAFAVGVVSSAVWLPFRQVPALRVVTPYEQGKAEAASDIAAGRIIIRTYGQPIVGYNPYKEILAEEYNVELNAVAGCIVTTELVENVRGYNEVQEAEIESRYGVGILSRVEQRAKQVYEEYEERNPD